MKAELLGEYQVSGWGYRIPLNCLITTRNNYKRILKRFGEDKNIENEIKQFFAKHPRAKRVIISL